MYIQCKYMSDTRYVHVLWFTYSLSTSYIQFLTFLSYASWQESSILYIDCLDHTETTLIPVGTGYTQLSRIWSGSVQVVRILWLFSFSGKHMYIRVNTLYIHVCTCIYPKNWKAIESWPLGQSLTRFEIIAYSQSRQVWVWSECSLDSLCTELKSPVN